MGACMCVCVCVCVCGNGCNPPYLGAYRTAKPWLNGCIICVNHLRNANASVPQLRLNGEAHRSQNKTQCKVVVSDGEGKL